MTISDDEQSDWIVTAGSSVAESAGFLSFTVSRSGSISAQATLTFDAASTDAVAGMDYTATHQTLSFASGEASKVVLVPILNDSVAEMAEQIFGVISEASVGSLSFAGSAVSVLENDSTRTRFSISGGTHSEDGGSGFTISRSGDTSSAQTIEYYNVMTGTATADADYVAFSPTLVSFAAGELSKTVSVNLIADTLVEGNETLVVGLRNASAGAIVTTTATITLQDNDSPVAATSYAILVGSNNVYEDTGLMQYRITRSGDTSAAAITYFRTNGGTATANSDYTEIPSQAISWAAGETIKTVFVHLTNDSAAESTETLIGEMATDSGFTIGLVSATGNILDNDTAAASNTYALGGSVNFFESSGTQYFAITRSGDLSVTSTSYFRTNGGTATADTDYTAIPVRTLNWGVGEVVKSVTVTVATDSAAEANETIIGESSTDSGFSTVVQATSTVRDDDTYTAAAGVADILTIGTVNGSYLGGSILDTGDLGDSVTLNGASFLHPASVINLGSGNDTFTTNAALTTARFIGGTGVDTLAATSTLTFSTIVTPGSLFTGFEIVSLLATGNQTLNLSLADVLEFTSGNTVADTLRITGAAGDILNLQALGKTLSTPAPGTGNLTDVDGTTYNVVASAAGNASTNDVTIGGSTYDVYQYQHSGHTVNLLVNTLLTTNVI